MENNIVKLVAPSRVRGLKPLSIFDNDGGLSRTFTGAWIETYLRSWLPSFRIVAPSRVRGLKLKRAEDVGRGLLRRTFTGAWIETGMAQKLVEYRSRRTFTGAWIETLVTSHS